MTCNDGGDRRDGGELPPRWPGGIEEGFDGGERGVGSRSSQGGGAVG